MSDDLQPVLKNVFARNAEAIQHAQQIAEKVKADNQSGFYTAEKLPAPKITSDPKYLKDGAANCQKYFGKELSTYLCGLDDVKVFARWAKGTAEPNVFQSHKLRSLIEVVEILQAAGLAPVVARQWMTSPNDYMLGWLPMDEMAENPSLVRRAALFLLS